MTYRFLFALLLLVCAVSTQAADWPRYHGPDNNGISKETGLLKSWPAGGPKIIWQKPIGFGYSSISVANGRVFTMFQDDENQYVVAFDEKTGEQLWKAPTGRKYIDPRNDGHDGPRCTPTVDGKFVYALDAHGEVVCLNFSDGKPVWHENILTLAGAKNIRWGMAQSPFIVGKMLILNPGGNGATYMALDKTNGKVIWKSGNGGAGYSTPVLAKIGGVEQLVFAAGQEVAGVSPKDGKVLWTFPFVNNSRVNAASPIVMDDMVFASSGYRRGSIMLKIDMSNAAQPVTKLWDNRNLECHFGTPILMDGMLYGYKQTDLTCVDFKTGQPKWVDTTEMPSKGQLTYADGLYYALGEAGEMALAKLTPQGIEKAGSMEISPGRERWAPLVVANGRLFMRDDKQIYCLDIKAK